MNIREALEPLLTIHEALAWVQFRTIEAVAAARTPEGLAGFRLLQEDPSNDRALALRQALREARLSANGQTRDGIWQDIPARDWFSLPVAPLTLERQRPYVQITVPRDDLLRLFPVDRPAKPRGAPPKYDWPWIKSEAAKEPPQSQGSLAEVLIARFEEKTGQRVGLSTMKRRLSRWGY